MPGASIFLSSIISLSFHSIWLIFSMLSLSLSPQVWTPRLRVITAKKTGHVYSCCFSFTSHSDFLSLTITFSLTQFLSLFTCFFLPLVCHRFHVRRVKRDGRDGGSLLSLSLTAYFMTWLGLWFSQLVSLMCEQLWGQLCGCYRWLENVRSSSSIRGGVTCKSPEINKNRTSWWSITGKPDQYIYY